MTPAARVAAAIALLTELAAAPRRPADAIAHDFFRSRRFIGGGDRRAIAERAWGVVRQRLRLDWHLKSLNAPITPRLLVVAHAALLERLAPAAVTTLFAGGDYGAPPLASEELGLLRRLEGRPLLHRGMPEGARLNLPSWALPGLSARFGDALATEAAAMEAEAPLDLRANLLRTTRSGAAAALAAEGFAAVPTPWSPWGLRLPARQPVTATAAYRDGLVEVQDEGSQMIALLADARPGLRVLDLCAGAGGKTLAMAATMGNRGRIAVCDISAARLEGAGRRLKRAGVDNAERHLLTAGDRWAKRRAGGFDRVLVDAPCTGSGTWRRNPDGRVRTSAADLAELVTRQGEIRDMAAELVRPGGRLIYATCSLLPEEDEAGVQAFLDRHPDFAVLPLGEAWAAADASGPPPSDGAHLVMTPARHGTDGFFATVLVRGGGAA